MQTCRFQFASGLFVDLYKKNILVKKAPILVLNGNIGYPGKVQTHDFIKYCSKTWDNVYYVPGMHELRAGVGFMRYTYGPFSNVTVLHNEAVLNNDTLFVGSYDDAEYISSTCKMTSEDVKIVALSFIAPAIIDKKISAWICYDQLIKGHKHVQSSDVLELS